MQQRQSAQAELEHLFRQERDIDQNELKQRFQQHTEANKVEVENFIQQQLTDNAITNTNQSVNPIDPAGEIALESLTHDQSNHDYEQYQADHSLYHIRLEELKQAYDQAKERYSHYESHFSQIAEKESITFDQAIANENRQDFWNSIVDALNTAHKDIEEYVKESPV
jgi:hypothetical protein